MTNNKLSPEQKQEQLNHTFELVSNRLKDFTFALSASGRAHHPEFRDAFQHLDNSKGQVAFMETLRFCVPLFWSSSRASRLLQARGVELKQAGWNPEHVRALGTVFLKTIKVFSKRRWSEQAEQAWAETLDVALNEIITAMKDSETATSPDVSSPEMKSAMTTTAPAESEPARTDGAASETGAEAASETGAEAAPETGAEAAPETGAEATPETAVERKPETTVEVKQESVAPQSSTKVHQRSDGRFSVRSVGSPREARPTFQLADEEREPAAPAAVKAERSKRSVPSRATTNPSTRQRPTYRIPERVERAVVEQRKARQAIRSEIKHLVRSEALSILRAAIADEVKTLVREEFAPEVTQTGASAPVVTSAEKSEA
jgi:hypothetical protein